MVLTLRSVRQTLEQVIAEPEERYEAYCASSDFIREHIFPGGHLPSLGAMVAAARPTPLQARLTIPLEARWECYLPEDVLLVAGASLTCGSAVLLPAPEKSVQRSVQLGTMHADPFRVRSTRSCSGKRDGTSSIAQQLPRQVHDVRDIGPHYAVTLRAWRHAWETKKDAILNLGYSDRFWRKYRCGHSQKEPPCMCVVDVHQGRPTERTPCRRRQEAEATALCPVAPTWFHLDSI